MIYSVSSELYLEAAARLTEHIGGSNYFSGTFSFPFDGSECRFTGSVIVYRRCESLPEGACERITDLVPVWWEFHTFSDGVEVLNDFSFNQLRASL